MKSYKKLLDIHSKIEDDSFFLFSEKQKIEDQSKYIA